MVYDGIVIGLLVGFLRAGFGNGMIALTKLRIRGGWIFPVLLIFQLGLYYLESKQNMLADLRGYLFMLVYVAGLIVLWLNRREKGFGFIFIGVFLNFLVMLVNGGKMPVSLDAASVLDPIYVQMLKDGTVVSKHIMLTSSTHLPFLGDIIPLTKPYPRNQAISIGDVIMNLGIFIYIQHVMLAQKAEDRLGAQKHLHTANHSVREEAPNHEKA